MNEQTTIEIEWRLDQMKRRYEHALCAGGVPQSVLDGYGAEISRLSGLLWDRDPRQSAVITTPRPRP